MYNPHYTLVVVARNDNYGGDFIRRVTFFAKMLRRQLNRHPGLFELVVVNWNPLEDRPSIAKAVDWRMNARVRVVTVTPELHRQLCQNAKMPVLEYWGKNVGIQRASSPYVIVTNPDICLSDELVDFLALKKLDPNGFYRLDRYDFRPEAVGLEDMAADYKAMQEAVFQVFGRNIVKDTHYTDADNRVASHAFRQERVAIDYPIYYNDWQNDLARARPTTPVANGASGDFIMASKDVLLKAGGFLETVETFTHLDSLMTFRLKGRGHPQYLMTAPLTIFHMDHSRAEQAERPQIEDSLMMQHYRAALSNQHGIYDSQKNWGLSVQSLEETIFNIQGAKIC